MKEIKEIEIRKIPVSEINPAIYNPRLDLRPNDPAYQKLRKSMVAYGYVELLVWNQRTKTLVSGHQRLKILIEQGVTEVEVSVVDLSLKQEKACNLSLNKIGGDWDEDKLAVFLEELQNTPDFDVDPTGFDSSEISQLLDNYHKVKEDENFTFEGAVEFAKEPITQKGDLIEIGPHHVYCGDTAQEVSLRNVLGEDRIDILHMDNPYGVSYDAKNRPGAHEDTCWKAIQNDELKGKDHVNWFKQVLITIKPFLKPSASFYFWDGFINFGPITQVLVENGFHVSNVIAWVKPTACPSFADYWFQSEFLLYGWLKSGIPHRWFGPNGESNVWKVDREPIGDLQHPTMKPTELARRAIKNSSVRGDIVFDGCMGAGFNLLACQQLNRVFRGIEIEPIYVDVAIRRYIRMFGRDSVSAEILKKYGKEA
jgi:DNA modification methylase